jgi:hypothetical protein
MARLSRARSCVFSLSRRRTRRYRGSFPPAPHRLAI